MAAFKTGLPPTAASNVGYFSSTRLHRDWGLGAETFRGFQLAGGLFLLTCFFIEPEGGECS
jgi:hypothetical protein